MACGVRCSRGLKICCIVTAIVIILLVVTLVVLFLTVFKPKDPIITVQSVTLERFDATVFPVIELNSITLGIVATVKNRNHGSFSYQNSTAIVNYRGNLVGEAPIMGDTVPDRGELNVSTSLTVYADVLAKDENFRDDLKREVVNFTSANTLHGKVKILNLIKMKATSSSNCDISVFILNKSVNSTCQNKIKL